MVSKPSDNGGGLKRPAAQAESVIVQKKWKSKDQNMSMPWRVHTPVANFHRDNLRYVDTSGAPQQMMRQKQEIKRPTQPEMKEEQRVQKENYAVRAKVPPQMKEIKRAVDAVVTKREVEKKVKEVLVDNGRVERTDTTEVLDRPVMEPEGHYEMSPLLQGALDRELDSLMQKVLKCLPTKVKSEADQFAIDTFRNETVHKFRDVLGLNVTKRVLNVYNKLYVKLKFSLPPTAPVLQSLRARYKMALLRPAGGDTAAVLQVAGFQSVQDFDRICAAKQFHCQGITITATPIYRFTVCPPQLKISTSHESTPDAPGDSTKPKSKNLSNLDNAGRTEPQTIGKTEIKGVLKMPIVENRAAALTVKGASVSKSLTPQAKKAPPVSVTKTVPVTNQMQTVKETPVAAVEVPQVKKEPQSPVKISVSPQVKKQSSISKPVTPAVKKAQETPMSKPVTPQVKQKPTVTVTKAPVKNEMQSPVQQVKTEPQTQVKISAVPEIKKQSSVSKPLTPTVKIVQGTPTSKPVVSVTKAPSVKNEVQTVKQTPVPQVKMERQTPVKISAATEIKKQVSKPVTDTVKKVTPVGELDGAAVKKQPSVVKPVDKDIPKQKVCTEVYKKVNDAKEKSQIEEEEIDFDSLLDNALVLDECNSDDD